MVLRAAFPPDAPAVAGAFLSMMEEAGMGIAQAHHTAPRLTAAIARGIEDGTQAWFVCEQDGTIVACAGAILMATPLDLVLDGKRAIIAGVYTHPAYRQRGGARKAVSAAVNWCKNAGVKVVRLQTTEPARGLYESLGFTTGDVMTLKL
jgi:GNAT superfamily N-acetyltransferase